VQRAVAIFFIQDCMCLCLDHTCNERHDILIRNKSYEQIQFKSIPELKYRRCLRLEKYDAHDNLDSMVIFLTYNMLNVAIL
jgi:hypothetical protein